MSGKKRIVYITGVGNNENCILSMLERGYDPVVFVYMGPGHFQRRELGPGGLVVHDFRLPCKNLLFRLMAEGKYLLAAIEDQIGCGFEVVIVDAPHLARWVLDSRKKYRINKVVYMCSDFFPWSDRSISFLRRLYRRLVFHPMDVSCARRADMTWNVSQRIIDERARYAPDLAGASHIVKYEMSFRPPPKEQVKSENRILYVGFPRRDHCLEMLVDVLKELKNTRSIRLKLDLVGHSPYVEHLKKYIIKAGIDEDVSFHGTLLNENSVSNIASKCFMGYALYRSEGKENYSYFGFPTKIIHYFAMGLPVVISDLTEFSVIAKDRGVCCTISEEKEMLKQAVLEIMDKGSEYRDNIERFVCDQNERACTFYRRSMRFLLQD